MLAMVGLLVGSEVSRACPPGGLLALDCAGLQRITLRVLSTAAVLYVLLLSGVVAWARRSPAARQAARDWYLLAALVGLPLAPLTAFSLIAAFGGLG